MGCVLIAAADAIAKQPAPQQLASPAWDRQGDLLSRSLPDLVITGLRMTADGIVQYEIANRAFKSNETPFVVDIYIGTARRDTLKHQNLPARSKRTVTSDLAIVEGCNKYSIRAAADPQNAVRESNESNNERRALLGVPLPDLAVTSNADGSPKIKPVKVKGEPRYRLRVTLVNQGNYSMPRVKSSIYSGAYPPTGSINLLRSSLDFIEPGPLRLNSGEEVSVIVGPKRLTRKNWFASVDLNYEKLIRECDRTNNRLEWHN